MTKQKILALDLGQRTGWAVVREDGKIVSGSCRFERAKHETVGAVWRRFAEWLDDTIRPEDCDLIVYEDVFNHTGIMAAHWYGGFWAHLTATADRKGIPCRGVGVGTIKASACGIGNASKTDIIRAMREKGHNPMDTDEADALAILHWAIGNDGAVKP